MQELLQGLTECQRAAVTHTDGPLLILAGPGSGKTRVITHRIANLLAQGVPASSILALTFTNKAADEMRRRVHRMAPSAHPWMGTFHRFGAQLLRRYGALAGLKENYSILDVEDSKKVLKQALQEAEIDLLYATPGQVANVISSAKSRVITPEAYRGTPGDPAGAIAQQVYPHYQRLLRQANAVDFDDLLLLPACVLRDHPELRGQLDRQYAYIMVDEYQDTNLAQYAIVRSLSNDLPNLAVTGDPDQSIYSWRGATISNIMQFESDYDQVQMVKLEQNYRSTPDILRAADTLIAHNKQRKPKQLFTDKLAGAPVRLVCYGDHAAEASEIAARIANDLEDRKVTANEVAIFYRVNALSRSLELALSNQGVPYKIVRGVEFYQRKEVKDLLAFLHLVNNPQNDWALLRVINSPPRGIGQKTIERLKDYARQQKVCLLEACRAAGSIQQLKGRAPVAVARFVHLMDTLSMLVHRPIEEILGRLVTESGYLEHLEASEHEEDQERVANIDELLTAAREFDEQHADASLDAFLERTSLVNDTDEWDAATERVTLMTLHAAKGLEFDHVYVVGVEQGLLPHARSRESERELEEERRLLFVGMTRARRELQLSYAMRRPARGGVNLVVQSPFLLELPTAEMDVQRPPGSYHYVDVDEHAQPEAPPEFETIDVRESERSSPAAASAPAASAPAASVLSAAEMLGEKKVASPASPRISPDVFQHGMLVSHPEYGVGTILALSGKGKKRQASIRFLGPQPDSEFILAFSPLQPVVGKVAKGPGG